MSAVLAAIQTQLQLGNRVLIVGSQSALARNIVPNAQWDVTFDITVANETDTNKAIAAFFENQAPQLPNTKNCYFIPPYGAPPMINALPAYDPQQAVAVYGSLLLLTPTECAQYTEALQATVGFTYLVDLTNNAGNANTLLQQYSIAGFNLQSFYVVENMAQEAYVNAVPPSSDPTLHVESNLPVFKVRVSWTGTMFGSGNDIQARGTYTNPCETIAVANPKPGRFAAKYSLLIELLNANGQVVVSGTVNTKQPYEFRCGCGLCPCYLRITMTIP